MELIGNIERRKIYYVQVRNNADWSKSIPKRDWLAFTISNKEDEEYIPKAVKKCLDMHVSFTCSAGDFGESTEQYFDEEVSWRDIDQQSKVSTKNDNLLTTSHHTIEEGFYYATTISNIENNELNNIVCIDFTKKKIKNQLLELINKINDGWNP